MRGQGSLDSYRQCFPKSCDPGAVLSEVDKERERLVSGGCLRSFPVFSCCLPASVVGRALRGEGRQAKHDNPGILGPLRSSYPFLPSVSTLRDDVASRFLVVCVFLVPQDMANFL